MTSLYVLRCDTCVVLVPQYFDLICVGVFVHRMLESHIDKDAIHRQLISS